MDYNNGYEQEIDLKELMFAVFRKWRPILLFAVILAVALGGYKAISTYIRENDSEVMEEAQKEYEQEMEQYHRDLERREREIKNLKEDIENQENYLEKSILVNMSPYDVWEAKTDLFIKTDYEIMPSMTYQNIDFTATVLQAYQSILTSTEFMNKIAAGAGVETRYLREVVTISIGKSDNRVNNLLTIQVRQEDEQKAKSILKEFVDGVYQYQKRIESSIGTHTISEVSSSLGSLVDLSLADKQESESDRLTNLNNSLKDKEKALEEMEEPEPVTTSIKAALKSGIKYAVIGGVLGAFMVMFVVCVMFLMSDKVYSAKELKYRFKVKILGTLPQEGAKKPNKIDLWLNRLEGREYHKDTAKEYGLICANIRNYTEGSKSLLVVGNAKKDVIDHVASELSERLEDVEIISGGSLIHNAKSLGQLPECDGIVLVEQCKVSLYSAVELEIEKSRDLNKPVVGCVVFE